MKIKRISILFLSCLLIVISSFGSYAAVHSSSNAVMALSLDSDVGIMPLSDEGGEGIDIYAAMYNASTGKLVKSVYPSLVNGVYKFPAPQDGCYYKFLSYRLYSAKAGTYNAVWTIKEANTSFNIQYINGYMNRNNGFASDAITKQGNFQMVSDSTGNVYTGTCNFVIPYDIAYMALEWRIDETGAFDFKHVSFSMNYGLSSAATNISEFPTDSSGSANDVIINQNSQLVNTSNSIYESLQDLIQHISNQLAALWDQMYNLMHVPTMAKLDEILSALRAIANNSDIYAVVEEIDSSSREQTSQIVQNANENTSKVEQAVEKHGNFIIEGLKGLFIPSDEYFKGYFDDLYTFFSDRFGFLSFPIDLLQRLADLFLNSDDVDCVLTIPSFEISGEQLLIEQSFNLTEFLESNFSMLLSAIRIVGDCIIIGAFVNLCSNKWDEVMKN